ALHVCRALAAALGGGGAGWRARTEAAVPRAGAAGPLVQCQLRRARAEGPDAQHLRGRGGRCVAAVPGRGAGPGGGRLDPDRAGGAG
ncbi:unnamed protein product, partial [Gulo gulo]